MSHLGVSVWPLAFGGNNYIEREIEGLKPDVVLERAFPKGNLGLVDNL